MPYYFTLNKNQPAQYVNAALSVELLRAREKCAWHQERRIELILRRESTSLGPPGPELGGLLSFETW